MKTIVHLLHSFRTFRSFCGRDSSRFSDADVSRAHKAMQTAASVT